MFARTHAYVYAVADVDIGIRLKYVSPGVVIVHLFD